MVYPKVLNLSLNKVVSLREVYVNKAFPSKLLLVKTEFKNLCTLMGLLLRMNAAQILATYLIIISSKGKNNFSTKICLNPLVPRNGMSPEDKVT